MIQVCTILGPGVHGVQALGVQILTYSQQMIKIIGLLLLLNYIIITGTHVLLPPLLIFSISINSIYFENGN